MYWDPRMETSDNWPILYPNKFSSQKLCPEPISVLFHHFKAWYLTYWMLYLSYRAQLISSLMSSRASRHINKNFQSFICMWLILLSVLTLGSLGYVLGDGMPRVPSSRQIDFMHSFWKLPTWIWRINRGRSLRMECVPAEAANLHYHVDWRTRCIKALRPGLPLWDDLAERQVSDILGRFCSSSTLSSTAIPACL